MPEPPPFKNADTCSKCNCKFSLIKRKHHCRNCGDTCCDACSSFKAALPHFDLLEQVRVCQPCHISLAGMGPTGAVAKVVTEWKPAVSDVNPETAPAVAAVVAPKPKKKVPCTCNMPLCICADEEEEVVKEVKEVKQTPVKVEKKVPTSASKPTNTMFMTSKRVTEKTYDLKGNLEEQIREAVKNTDVNGVKILLEAGANPKFVDATSNSLAHLAAMFDSLVIVEMLHAKGADLMLKNQQGETPIDVAPVSLAFKMKKLL